MSVSNSEVSSKDSQDASDISWDGEESENRDYFVNAGRYAPYRGEPLARNNNENSDCPSEHEEADEDGILPSVLEQRFNREITVDNW